MIKLYKGKEKNKEGFKCIMQYSFMISTYGQTIGFSVLKRIVTGGLRSGNSKCFSFNRGNITAMIRQFGYPSVATDYIFYLYEVASVK